MLVLVLLFVLIAYILWRKPEQQRTLDSENISMKIDKLWRAAQEAIIDKKFLRAEKILLTILRFDERNSTAYNRLGIIYAGQKNFPKKNDFFFI